MSPHQTAGAHRRHCRLSCSRRCAEAAGTPRRTSVRRRTDASRRAARRQWMQVHDAARRTDAGRAPCGVAVQRKSASRATRAAGGRGAESRQATSPSRGMARVCASTGVRRAREWRCADPAPSNVTFFLGRGLAGPPAGSRKRRYHQAQSSSWEKHSPGERFWVVGWGRRYERAYAEATTRQVSTGGVLGSQDCAQVVH